MGSKLTPNKTYRFLSQPRRVVEDRRFVAGKGRYIANYDHVDMAHVALMPCHLPAARIDAIDANAALATPGVIDVVTGAELAAAIDPLMNGLDTPNVRRYPLAVGQVRYAGEWVCAVIAESRAIAEDAMEKIRLKTTALPFVLDSEQALRDDSPPVHPDHNSNVLLDKRFVWGPVDDDFADAEYELNFCVTWGRNSTVPIETFGVVAEWNAWDQMLDIRASVQMPKYADQIARALKLAGNQVRVHYDIDVGGSYGVKRGIKHAVLVGYLARKLHRPVRLIEDRLENMRAGDAHGPERKFDVSVAFEKDGTVRSMRMRALDNAGAYAGRAPFQLGKPIGAIVGPYRINSVAYQAISVTTNKAAQEAVRGFGQAPTNYALETAIDRVAAFLDIDRLTLRQHNLIKADEFPYSIPSGSTYDSGDYHTVIDKVLAAANYPKLITKCTQLRKEGMMAGIGIAACLEPSGGNSSFEPLLNENNHTTTWMESCQINIDALGTVVARIHTTSSGQGHETLVSTIIAEVLGVDPDSIRVVRPNSLESLPGNSPVGSRMAIMLGGAAARAAEKLKAKIVAIAAHQLKCDAASIRYHGDHMLSADGRQITWDDIIELAHRQIHELPDGMDPGLASFDIMQVPTGGDLPKDGKVQMYPCYSFEFHLVLVAFDPIIGKPEILSYTIGHDCGTVINPAIVSGMTYGGIAHGIGAALLEEFAYDESGQLITQSFLDYLMPSSHEVPDIQLVKHCTPSPHTVFGQKGSGESGYLGAPAAISSAINNAVAGLNISFDSLPMRMSVISDAIAAQKRLDK